ncbi:MAG: aminotransferase class V-fold PLP-dependent enzyme [Candidatus Uhrbacteria bacterium]|nr:aminotransferase class V-fold PLP-dependent enzyme [Candidatus Uhrbacteria bacterium]
MQVRNVYMDHAAATPIDRKVVEVMLPFLNESYGNPSSFHSVGKVASDAILNARSSIAQILGARADEVIFTSGGTESDNLAILGYARKNKDFGKHIITTKAEHEAVLESCAELEREGFEVTYLDVDEYGMVTADQVEGALRDDTILASVIYANNEIGTVNPIREIGAKIQRARKGSAKNFPVLHIDACQAASALELNIQKLNVDMLTLNGSKIYGPKGAGLLYVRRGIKLQPLQFGGAQEKRVRPGTENVAGIVGLASALQIADDGRVQYVQKTTELRDKLINGILSSISKTRLNGHKTERLPNNVNISFMDIEGEALLLYLDSKGVYVSTGSACTSQSLDPSHVILALGMPYEVAHGSIRFSLGRDTTEEDVDYVLETLPPLVEKLRKISPVKVDEKYY